MESKLQRGTSLSETASSTPAMVEIIPLTPAPPPAPISGAQRGQEASAAASSVPSMGSAAASVRSMGPAPATHHLRQGSVPEIANPKQTRGRVGKSEPLLTNGSTSCDNNNNNHNNNSQNSLAHANEALSIKTITDAKSADYADYGLLTNGTASNPVTTANNNGHPNGSNANKNIVNGGKADPNAAFKTRRRTSSTSSSDRERDQQTAEIRLKCKKCKRSKNGGSLRCKICNSSSSSSSKTSPTKPSLSVAFDQTRHK